MSTIKINGINKEINQQEITILAQKFLPNGMASLIKKQFIRDVVFLIADLEIENIDTNGKSIEEYFFAACLAYAEENGFSKFFEEEDSTKIFEYCGSEL